MAGTSISSEFLIVCEGEADEAFFRYLCADRNIQGFQVEITGHGNSGFRQYFEGLLGRSGSDRLKGVLVASDNDAAPNESFKLVRDQLKRAKVPTPDNPLEALRWSTVEFAVAIMMIPFADGICQKGCLETLLLKTAMDKFPAIYACVETYAKCAGVDDWTKLGAIDKMRLRSILSAAWSDDPNLGLQYALIPTKGLLPLQHACFDGIADFIRTFPSKATSARVRS